MGEDAYQEGKAIGKGSFGSVFLVRRRSDGKELVMKKMHIGNISAKEQQGYEMEVRLLSQLVGNYCILNGLLLSICM